jgi:hypothetical protein
LSGRSYVTTLDLAYESPRGSPAAEVALTVNEAAAADIASQSPALAWLSVIDAPLSASLRGRLDQAGELTDFRASLKLGAGALAPVPGAAPVTFDYARADLTYDPAAGVLRFPRVAVLTAWGGAEAEGHAYLQDMTGGWPGALLGQFAFSEITLNPGGVYPEALSLAEAFVDFRLRLDPFRLTVGQFVVTGLPDGGLGRLAARAEIGAAPEGWSVAVDATLDRITRDRALALWPATVKPITRGWFDLNLTEGLITGITAGLRLAPGADPHLAVTHEFQGVTVRPMRRLPPITGAAGHASYDDGLFSLTLAEGQVAPPQGGEIAVAGSSLLVPNINIPDPPATIRLLTDSTVTAALALIDMPPFGYPQAAGLPVTLADGRAQVAGRFDLPLMDLVPADRLDYQVTARLTDLTSEVLVPGRRLSAGALDLTLDPGGMTVAGPVRLGQVAADLVLRQDFGTPPNPVRISGTVELSQSFLDEFRIGLPPGALRGEGTGEVDLTITRDAPPVLRLTSGLRGLTLALPALGWRKPAGTEGELTVEAILGQVPQIPRLVLDAAGLSVAGDIALTADGGLDRARFDQVRLDGWLDAPVTLIGRGDRPPAVDIAGGSLDLTRAALGDGEGEEGGPMTVALDRLQVTEGIALTGFRGEFNAGDALDGRFTAGVNGAAAVTGTIVSPGGRIAARITSAEAGAVLRAAGFLDTAEGGEMDLTLLPAGPEGSYDGTLAITGLRVREAPALASLLNAISVIGLLQQLGGQGLVFDEVEAEFRIDPDRITVLRSAAIGVGLGLSLDGVYTAADRNMDFQGVVSPFYLLNGIGAVLTRRGEGLVGFNFTLRGPLGDPRVGVNPLSILTPGMFREIFRRPPPVLE